MFYLFKNINQNKLNLHFLFFKLDELKSSQMSRDGKIDN